MFSYVFMKMMEMRPRSYDRVMDKISRGRVRAAKESVAAEVPEGSRVLEIGCGTGELASLLIARGATVEGFDPSPAMVKAAEERIVTEGLQDKISPGAEDFDVGNQDFQRLGSEDDVLSRACVAGMECYMVRGAHTFAFFIALPVRLALCCIQGCLIFTFQ